MKKEKDTLQSFDRKSDKDLSSTPPVPSTETIKKVISLYKQWYSQQLDGSVESYVKNNWE